MAPKLFPGAPVCGPFLGQPQVRALENLRPGVAGEGVASRWDFLTRPQGGGILWPLGRSAQTCSSSTSAPLGPKEEVFGQSHRWERRGGCPGRPGEGCAAQGSPSLGCSLQISRIVTCSRPCTTTGETEASRAARQRLRGEVGIEPRAARRGVLSPRCVQTEHLGLPGSWLHLQGDCCRLNLHILGEPLAGLLRPLRAIRVPGSSVSGAGDSEEKSCGLMW